VKDQRSTLAPSYAWPAARRVAKRYPPPPPPRAYGARYPDIGLHHCTTVLAGSPTHPDQRKKPWQNARASSIEPNRPGNSGRYLSVLNCASAYGLSLHRRRCWAAVKADISGRRRVDQAGASSARKGSCGLAGACGCT